MSFLKLILPVLICYILPTALVIYLYVKKKIKLSAVITGAVVFYVFQPLTRIKLLGLLQNMVWFKADIMLSTMNTALFYGLTAGIFEETGRFIAFKFILKNHLTYENGIAYGIGHGACEAIYLCFLPALISELSKISVGASAVMSFERLFAMTIHVGLSLVVLYGVKNKKYIYLLYAILIHGIIDAGSVLLSSSILLTESYVLIWAVLLLIFIIKSKKLFYSERVENYEK